MSRSATANQRRATNARSLAISGSSSLIYDHAFGVCSVWQRANDAAEPTVSGIAHRNDVGGLAIWPAGLATRPRRDLLWRRIVVHDNQQVDVTVRTSVSARDRSEQDNAPRPEVGDDWVKQFGRDALERTWDWQIGLSWKSEYGTGNPANNPIQGPRSASVLKASRCCPHPPAMHGIRRSPIKANAIALQTIRLIGTWLERRAG